MSAESKKQNFRPFIYSLAAIALIFNFLCFKIIADKRKSDRCAEEQRELQQAQEQKQQQDQAQARKAAEKAAAERAQYLARYKNINFARNAGIKSVAVAAASENTTFNEAVVKALADHLKTDAVETLPVFFNPEFVSDGLLNEGFGDVRGITDKLALTNSLDGLLLARQSVEYSSNPSLDNVLTATMRLDVLAYAINGGKNTTWKFTAAGAGFNQATARAMAEERIIRQIYADTNMSLSVISSHN